MPRDLQDGLFKLVDLQAVQVIPCALPGQPDANVSRTFVRVDTESDSWWSTLA